MERGTQGGVQATPARAFGSLPVQLCGQHLIFPKTVCEVTALKGCCQPGKLTEALVSRVLLGISHVGVADHCVADLSHRGRSRGQTDAS